MDQSASDQARPRGKHLLTPEVLARAAEGAKHLDLTRAHGQGNGLRVHLIYFGVASLAVLVVLIVGIALAGRMM